MKTAEASAIKNKSLCQTSMHIDHIIPRSKGGADHPSNYYSLCGTINSPFGNTFSLSKCFLVGADACAQAVLCSGLFGGNYPYNTSSATDRYTFRRYDNSRAEELLKRLMDAATVGFRLQLTKAIATARNTCTFANQGMLVSNANWPANSALLKRHLLDNQAVTALLKSIKAQGTTKIKEQTQALCNALGACPSPKRNPTTEELLPIVEGQAPKPAPSPTG